MKILLYLLITILLTALQTTLVPHLAIFGVVPSLVLAFVTCMALLRGSREGGVIGFFSGFLTDLASGGTLGAWTLLYLYAGVICGLFTTRIFRERYLIAVILSVSASVFTGFLHYFFSFTIWGKGGLYWLFWRNTAIEAAYQAILTLPVFCGAKQLHRWLQRRSDS